LVNLSGDQIDMLITDLNMPNMDGLELIKKVREEGKQRFTPIVMLTAESSEEKKKAGREARASDWIVKPFKPEQLLKVVKMVLGE
jgi:two-component system chemotaxis response regulator CheY